MVSSGRVADHQSLKPGLEFQDGYVEMRANIPSGQGLWSAFWMLPTTHEPRPEIDIFEILGDTADTYRTHIHYLDADGERQTLGEEWTLDESLSIDWHVNAVEWTATSVTWLLDGEPMRTLTEADAIPHEPLYLLANLAVGGDWPGPPDDTTEFPAIYAVDYIRVWQEAP
jgi:beta-glucanase (GH16 family)